MSRNFFGLTLSVCAFLALATASSATVITIADWKFAGTGAALTADSGPNGYTLTNNGGVTYGNDLSPAPNEPASGNYALFSGTNFLQTSASIGLSSYTNVTLSWSMYLNTASDVNIYAGGTGALPFAQSGDAIWVKANDSQFNSPSTPNGFAGLTTGGNANLTSYGTASGTSPQWDSYKAVFDLTQPANTIVTVYKDGVLDTTFPAYSVYQDPLTATAFGNLLATIGAAADGSKGFVGKLGEVELTTFAPTPLPEPSSLLLLGFACAAVLVRGRKRLTALAAARLGR